ncbi:hypothetical protein [Burkholderia pseudomallei]|uniref:hypothetical protein n=1 Tax=Burkholderia pseudomallei TaxID=28450 RepID=UPI0011C23787|nr:hypothetical protein [Burkholderia pseudomallei]
MQGDVNGALQVLTDAFEYVNAAGLQDEVEWQRNTCLDDFTESDLLRESAWVILCSGFREATVRHYFDFISLCFCDWESAEAIMTVRDASVHAARSVFRHERKLRAIVDVAHRVAEVGFEAFKVSVMADPIGQLQRLPFVGPVTVWHLAKNLGLDTAKPDRHLVRISKKLGFGDVHEFCRAISNVSGYEVKVVDLVIWRYLADNPVHARTL